MCLLYDPFPLCSNHCITRLAGAGRTATTTRLPPPRPPPRPAVTSLSAAPPTSYRHREEEEVAGHEEEAQWLSPPVSEQQRISAMRSIAVTRTTPNIFGRERCWRTIACAAAPCATVELLSRERSSCCSRKEEEIQPSKNQTQRTKR